MVGIYDASGTIVARYEYDAWGNQLTEQAPGSIGELNPIRYRGYYYDNETGYYYCQSRYYNPEWCRWISADALMSTGQGVLGTNMYAYCRNNPVNRCDPSGAFDINTKEAVDIFAKNFLPYAADNWKPFANDTFSNVAQDIGKIAGGSAAAAGPYGWALAGLLLGGIGVGIGQGESAKLEQQRTLIMQEAAMHRQLTKTAKKFNNLYCEEAAEAMANKLKENGWDFDVVGIVYPQAFNGYIHSYNKIGEEISRNSYHVGIRFKGIVYDNITPGGIPFEEWKASFYAIGPRHILVGKSLEAVMARIYSILH